MLRVEFIVVENGADLSSEVCLLITSTEAGWQMDTTVAFFSLDMHADMQVCAVGDRS